MHCIAHEVFKRMIMAMMVMTMMTMMTMMMMITLLTKESATAREAIR